MPRTPYTPPAPAPIAAHQVSRLLLYAEERRDGYVCVAGTWYDGWPVRVVLGGTVFWLDKVIGAEADYRRDGT